METILNDMVYLACPYTPIDAKDQAEEEQIKEERFRTVSAVAGMLMKEGVIVFSPITHSHIIANEHNLPTTWKFWRKQDMEFLKRSQRLVVLQLPGWKESKGVQEEIRAAKQYGLEVEYLDV